MVVLMMMVAVVVTLTETMPVIMVMVHNGWRAHGLVAIQELPCCFYRKLKNKGKNMSESCCGSDTL